jgi:citrate synthase
LRELAVEEAMLGPHLRLLFLVGEAHDALTGRHLSVNGAGAAGAVLVDIGFPPDSVRGVVLVARTAGLVAHLTEEAEDPIGMRLWREVEQRAGDASG